MNIKFKKQAGFFVGVLLLVVLAACGGKLTNENLNKVKNEMTEGDVKAILGKPSSVENSEILGLKNVSYLYESGGSKVNIHFINDNVISKHGSFK